MNINMRQANWVLQHSKWHVDTVKIHHKLKEATRFFRDQHGTWHFDIPDTQGYTQVQSSILGGITSHRALSWPSQSCTREPSRLHVHLWQHLVRGISPKEHDHNLDQCLTHLREKGFILCQKMHHWHNIISVSWFGTVFSKSGMSVDTGNIKADKAAGQPQSIDEVKNFFQAYQFNAIYDSCLTQQVPLPRSGNHCKILLCPLRSCKLCTHSLWKKLFIPRQREHSRHNLEE